MPNYCDNEIRIQGNKKDIAKLKEFVKEKPIHTGEPVEDLITQLTTELEDSNCFDFNEIHPVPQEIMSINTGVFVIKGIEYAATKENTDKTATFITEQELQQIEEKFGDIDERNFCINQWGTKGNSMSPALITDTPNNLLYSISTAWSPPIPIIEKLSKKFPKLKMTIRFWECGAGFKGKYVFKNGTALESIDKDYKHGNRGG